MKAEILGEKKPFYSLHLGILAHIKETLSKNKDFQQANKFEFACLFNLKPKPELAEKLIIKDESWTEALRLYCIYSMVNEGISLWDLSTLHRRLIQKFGIPIVQDLENLIKGKLIYPPTAFYKLDFFFGVGWKRISKSFNLLNLKRDDVEASKI